MAILETVGISAIDGFGDNYGCCSNWVFADFSLRCIVFCYCQNCHGIERLDLEECVLVSSISHCWFLIDLWVTKDIVTISINQLLWITFLSYVWLTVSWAESDWMGSSYLGVVNSVLISELQKDFDFCFKTCLWCFNVFVVFGYLK